MELYKQYHPITATPFSKDEGILQFCPCDALKPYIRCFWGTRTPIKQYTTSIEKIGVVTPDTCMDIMFSVDITNNKISSNFTGINDFSFDIYSSDNENKTVFSFAIRFFPWSASMFSEESLNNTKNTFFDGSYHFSKIKKEVERLMFDIHDMYKLIPMVEKILLKHIYENHRNTYVLQAIEKMIVNKGNLPINELVKYLHISDRQLERLFKEYIGVSPKSLVSMIRYQYLWNDIIFSREFNVLDAVDKFGFTDQSHLLHDFKKYHSMTLSEAKSYALKDVENIQ